LAFEIPCKIKKQNVRIYAFCGVAQHFAFIAQLFSLARKPCCVLPSFLPHCADLIGRHSRLPSIRVADSPIISAGNESTATSITYPRNWLNIAIVKKLWEENGKCEFVFAFKDEKTPGLGWIKRRFKKWMSRAAIESNGRKIYRRVPDAPCRPCLRLAGCPFGISKIHSVILTLRLQKSICIPPVPQSGISGRRSRRRLIRRKTTWSNSKP
jgi:hypothetical protein